MKRSMMKLFYVTIKPKFYISFNQGRETTFHKTFCNDIVRSDANKAEKIDDDKTLSIDLIFDISR